MFDQAALVEATQELEPLPPTVHQLAAIASRRNWSAMEADEAISMDPALTGKLPGLANPVAGGSRVEVVSIRDAVGERLEQVLSTYLSRPVATPRVAPRVDVFDAAPGHQSLVRVPLHSTWAASRKDGAGLLVQRGHTLPAFSLVTPRPAGASPVPMRRAR